MNISGVHDDIINAQKRFIFTFLLLFAMVGCSYFTYLNIQRGTLLIALIDAVMVCVSAVVIYITNQTKSNKKFLVLATIILLFYYTVLLIVLAQPTSSVTIYSWIFLIPPLTYTLLGKKVGFFVTALYVSLSLVIFVGIANPKINSSVIAVQNIISSVLSIWLIVHIYEVSNLNAKQKLSDLSLRDSLTGLYNRKVLIDVYQQYKNCKVLTSIILDIDFFKKINDVYGHDAGDKALIYFANEIKNYFEQLGYVVRIGGEEFYIVLPNIDLKTGAKLCQDFQVELARKSIVYEQHTISLTFSAGVSEYPLEGKSYSELLRIADHRLYHAKKSGRNCVVMTDEK